MWLWDAGSQKAIGVPPGLCIMIVSQRAMAQIPPMEDVGAHAVVFFSEQIDRTGQHVVLYTCKNTGFVDNLLEVRCEKVMFDCTGTSDSQLFRQLPSLATHHDRLRETPAVRALNHLHSMPESHF